MGPGLFPGCPERLGNRIRLYTEVAAASGRSYALERIGPSTAELLFLCGLDAVNAEAARAFRS
jgi:hypothetical protein